MQGICTHEYLFSCIPITNSALGEKPDFLIWDGICSELYGELEIHSEGLWHYF